MRLPFIVSLVALVLGVGVAASRVCASLAPAKSGMRERGAIPHAKRFTGTIRIRQQSGTLYYDFAVEQGKVISGVCAHQKRKGVLYDVVGGWYDGERLMLLLQSRGTNLNDQWFAHAHQFRRSGDTFELEHTLYGYGKSMDSGEVYTTHVIDRLEEKVE